MLIGSFHSLNSWFADLMHMICRAKYVFRILFLNSKFLLYKYITNTIKSNIKLICKEYKYKKIQQKKIHIHANQICTENAIFNKKALDLKL